MYLFPGNSYKWSVENEKQTRAFAHYLEEQTWRLWGKGIGNPQGVGFMRQEKFQPFFLENRLNYSLPEDWRKKTTQLQAESHHREDYTYDNSSLREANNVVDHLAKMTNTNQNNHVSVSFQQIPNAAKGPYQLDKSQMLSIRLENYLNNCIWNYWRQITYTADG